MAAEIYKTHLQVPQDDPTTQQEDAMTHASAADMGIELSLGKFVLLNGDPLTMLPNFVERGPKLCDVEPLENCSEVGVDSDFGFRDRR